MPRVRSRGSQQLSSLILQYGHPSYPPFLPQEKGTRMAGETGQIIDEVTSNYRQRRARGEIIMHPCTIQADSYQCTAVGHITIQHPNWGWENVDGDFAQHVVVSEDGASVSVLEQERIRNSALVKAYASMNASPVLGGEILSDLSKTVSMLRHPFKSATNLLNNMLTRRNKLLKSHSGDFAKANASCWLEYRYGWVPIISDSIKIMREAKKILARQKIGFQVARGRDKVSYKHTYSFVSPAIIGSFIGRGTGSNVADFACNAGILYRMKPTIVSDQVMQGLGLNARSIPATLWEIVPFSFVVDWFANVGPWIEAVTPRSDIEILSSWASSTYSYTRIVTGSSVERTIYNDPVTTYTGSLGSCITTSRSLNRVIDPGLPFTPSLKGKLPTVKQSVDALALSAGSIVRVLQSLRH